MTPQPDPANVAGDFLAHLFDDVPPEQWLTLFEHDRATGQREVKWHLDPWGLASMAAGDRCVWYGIATRMQRLASGRGTRDDCMLIPALWVDLDVAGPNHVRTDLPPTTEAALQLLSRFEHRASVVIRTGGGIQALWLLDEPADATTVEAMLPSWGATWRRIGAEHGWHIDNVFDVARVLRLPGTRNTKVPGRPTPVTIERATWELRYSLDELAERLDAPPAAPAPRQLASVPYIGPERPGDAFNAVTDPGMILEAAGWVLHSTDRGSGDRHYTRPGKRTQDGQSATVYADDNHVTVWTDSVPELQPRKPYTAFSLYAILQHRGDFAAASRDLAARGFGTPAAERGDVSWLAEGGGSVGSAVVARSPEPPPSPALAITWADDTVEIPAPEVLVTGLIERGSFTGIAAVRGVGKSFAAMNLATALDRGTGSVMGGFDVARRARVLMLHGEISPAQARRRWDRMTRPSSDPLAVPERPHVAEYFGTDLRFRVYEQRTRSQVDGAQVERRNVIAEIPPMLEASIVSHSIDVCIVDPWAVFNSGAENSNDEAEAVLSELRAITLRTGVAWVLIHHVSKATDVREPEDLWRGASRLADWVATRVTMLPHYRTASAWRAAGLDDRYQARRYIDVSVLRRDEPVPDFHAWLNNRGWWERWEPPTDESEIDDMIGRPVKLTPRDVVDALGRTGGRWESYREAGAHLDASPSAVRSAIDRAVLAGVVETEPGPRNATVITIAANAADMAARPLHQPEPEEPDHDDPLDLFG